MIAYGSVCSGIGAPEYAIRDIGWRCSFMSEIEKFPRAVLRHHFPDHPLHGDFTTIERGDYDPIDVLIGGTPCQDFSVAGKRLGLDAPRGNLALEYIALARRLGVRWLVWENVPGMLSSWSDDPSETASDGQPYQTSDFASFLDCLGQCGYEYAWRVLDGQHFGVPQRRRRIILVAYLGDWRPPAAVLFDRESLRRDITPRRKTGSGVARSITASTGGVCGKEQQHTFVSGGDVLNPLGANEVSHTLRGEGFDASEDGSGRGIPLIPDIALALQERDYKGSDSNTKDGHLIPVAFDCKASGSRGFGEGETAPTLRSMSSGDGNDNAGGQLAVAFESRYARNGRGAPSDIIPPLKAQSGETGKGDGAPLVSFNGVRRLTPRECERLMGLPDDWTLIKTGGGMAKDGPRYKAIGNSMIVPKMRWVLSRLDQVEKILQEAK